MSTTHGPIRSLPIVIAALALLMIPVIPQSLDAGGSSATGSNVQPNPFRMGEIVTFTLTIPSPGHEISINVYDVLGKHIRQLYPYDPSVSRAYFEPGIHPIPWDGTDKYGTPVIIGAYFCVLQSGDAIFRTVKVIKIRD